MGKNQYHNRQHLGALENSIIGNFLSIMWKSLLEVQNVATYVYFGTLCTVVVTLYCMAVLTVIFCCM